MSSIVTPYVSTIDFLAIPNISSHSLCLDRLNEIANLNNLKNLLSLPSLNSNENKNEHVANKKQSEIDFDESKEVALEFEKRVRNNQM